MALPKAQCACGAAVWTTGSVAHTRGGAAVRSPAARSSSWLARHSSDHCGCGPRRVGPLAGVVCGRCVTAFRSPTASSRPWPARSPLPTARHGPWPP
eukprot:353500-Chlamydomonas_euryale.AAC.5